MIYIIGNLCLCTTFNRTSVELKLQSRLSKKLTYSAFNRTSVELKQVSQRRVRESFPSFNRTSVELKPTRNAPPNQPTGRLLIEPVWN